MHGKIIALDPGVTTGVAVFKDYEIDAFNIEANHLELYAFLVNRYPNTIVYERFDYRPYQKVADLYPVEMIGIIKLYGQETGCTLVPQKQLKGDRGFWTDDKLKALDLYNVGEKGHSNDATRQLLYYLTFELDDQTFVERITT